MLGALTLARAYYHCARCETGFCPRDRALGLEGSSLSPGVLRMVGRVGAMVSFEEGHELLHELAGGDVPTSHVERAAEALGREIAEDERRRGEAPPANEPVAPTLYVGMDGTGVPMRAAEVEGRAGKQPDGSSTTREVKLCVVWSAEGRDAEDTPVRDPGSVTYSAAIESAAQRDTDEEPSPFATRVERETARPHPAARIPIVRMPSSRTVSPNNRRTRWRSTVPRMSVTLSSPVTQPPPRRRA